MQPTSPHSLSSATPTAQTPTLTPLAAPGAPQPQVHIEAPRAPLTDTQPQPSAATPVASVPAYAAPAKAPADLHAAVAAARALAAQQPANGMTALMFVAQLGHAQSLQLLQASAGERHEQP